ncbi:FecR family protein [Sphingomonas turrisvirgatae]|jgi:transmembrane sensor|uniref:FecR protein domain-containing protein n=1 Tax=Sphingomonas turrisvirgatae TaxID=1888892 RepID=A0A1E3LYA1_9SPHN|nr:FecR domain-containing protein [Sphingomonas turrisvirgatae]ODP38812.1 hypothetical protein BFL28_13565 [Sphingomonas turrisvirgatae]
MTDQARSDGPGRGSLTEEAAVWFARMRGPDAEAHRPAFEAWLAHGAPHRSAYNRAAEIFSMGKFLEIERFSPVLNYGVEAEGRQPSFFRRGVLVASVGVLAMLTAWFAGGPALIGIEQAPEVAERVSAGTAVYLQTAAGESRIERLADGSVVTLGPASRLRARFGVMRELTLDQGQALFQVAHEVRPFVVDARGTLVTARGTVFDVSIGAQQRVTVRLLQGLIDVERPIRSAKPVVERLRPGQSLVIDMLSAGVSSGTSPVDSRGAAFSAPRVQYHAGVREFEAARLGDLVAEANRLARIPIWLADPELGNLKVSGRFDPKDSIVLATRAATIFDLEIDRSDPSRIVLASRR